MVMEVNPVQFIKTQYSKVVTELEIVADPKLGLSAKAAAPMVLTELGIITDVSPV